MNKIIANTKEFLLNKLGESAKDYEISYVNGKFVAVLKKQPKKKAKKSVEPVKEENDEKAWYR